MKTEWRNGLNPINPWNWDREGVAKFKNQHDISNSFTKNMFKWPMTTSSICFRRTTFDSAMMPNAPILPIWRTHSRSYLMLIRSVTDLRRKIKSPN